MKRKSALGRIRRSVPLAAVLCWTYAGGCGAGQAGLVVYVDSRLRGSTTTYDPATRSAAGGAAKAYGALQEAASNAGPGTTVILRGGVYAEPLVPGRSGEPRRPVTFKGYPGETAAISGVSLEPAIDISGRSYVVIEGLTVTEVRRWMYAVRSHHDVIGNNVFTRALDKGGSSKSGLFFQEAEYNTIVGNTLEDGPQDHLSLIKSDHNLVEGNTLRKAKHTLWTIKCGSFNIVRNNSFHNELEKIGEVFDCDHVGFDHEITLVDATKHNLIERNVFAYTPSSGDHSPFAGIQYSAQRGIVRRNVFYETTGPALQMALYEREATRNNDNRIYNNVFQKTRFAGVQIAAASPRGLSGNVFKNNVLVRSSFQRNDRRWRWYAELEGKAVQVMIAGLEGFFFESNDILGARPGDLYVIAHGRRESSSNPAPQPLAWWEGAHPELFAGNLEVEPLFVDEPRHDFHLLPESPLIDAGAYLTTAVGSGHGTQLRVQDAGYFSDGLGIPGEPGDVIRLAGQSQTARIERVDYSANVLVLSEAVSWVDRQGVALDYAGEGPDLGAFEHRP